METHAHSFSQILCSQQIEYRNNRDEWISTDEWIMKMRSLGIMKFYSSVKKNAILKLAYK